MLRILFMEREILVVLGSPNSPNGELSTIAKDRLNFCQKTYQNNMMILCTGGWGDHFNVAIESHAFYLKKYLLEKGIPENCFLEFALSVNTVDDAVKIKEIISSLDNIHLTIVTSDYHLERVKLIFNEVLKIYKKKFVGVKTNLEKEKYYALIKHEKNAIEGILKNGLYY